MEATGITKALLIIAILLALFWNHIILYFRNNINRDKTVKTKNKVKHKKESTFTLKEKKFTGFINVQGIVRLTLILCIIMIIYLPTRIERFERMASFDYRFIWELGLYRESEYSFYSIVPDIKILIGQIFIASIIGALCAASLKK